MQGFGASGAWWPNDLVHFNSSAQQRVAEGMRGKKKAVADEQAADEDGAVTSVATDEADETDGADGATAPADAAVTSATSPGELDCPPSASSDSPR